MEPQTPRLQPGLALAIVVIWGVTRLHPRLWVPWPLCLGGRRGFLTISPLQAWEPLRGGWASPPCVCSVAISPLSPPGGPGTCMVPPFIQGERLPRASEPCRTQHCRGVHRPPLLAICPPHTALPCPALSPSFPFCPGCWCLPFSPHPLPCSWLAVCPSFPVPPLSLAGHLPALPCPSPAPHQAPTGPSAIPWGGYVL